MVTIASEPDNDDESDSEDKIHIVNAFGEKI